MRWFQTFVIALLLSINVQSATVIMPKSGMPAKPGQYCTDLAGVLSEPQRIVINEQLAQLDRDTGAELLVYIDRSLNGKPVEDFGREAFRSWGVGKKDKNNGMVFFLFTIDRKMRVEVGYGLEGAVPDSVAKQIIAQGVAPKLKKGAEDWHGGVVEAVNQLSAKIRKEGASPVATGPPKPQSDFFGSGSQSPSPSSSATSSSSKGSSSGASSKQPSAALDRDHQAAGVLLVGLLVVVVVVVVVALLISRRNRLERERLERYEQAMRDRDRRIREQLERERHSQATKPQRNYTTPAVMTAASTAAAIALVQPRKEPVRPKEPAKPNPAPTRRSYSDDDDDASSRRSSHSSSSSDYGSSSSSYDSGGGSCGGGGASSDF